MSIESSQRNPRRKRSGPGPTNLILAAVLFVICGAAYWLEIHKQSDAAREFANKPRLLTLDSAQELESLSITDHTGDKAKDIDLQFKCLNHCKFNDPTAEWRITAPLDFKADSSNVGTFISGLAAANVQETIPLEAASREATLKQFALDKDARGAHMATFKFKKDADPYKVYLGEAAAVGDNIYALVTGPGLKGDAVQIIPSFVKTNLQRPVSYWRSKRLFDFAASEVEGFRLKNPRGTVELAKDKNGGEWQLGPGKQMADNEAVDTWVTGLVFLNAHEFLSDDKVKDAAKLGIGPATPHFTLWLKVAKRPELQVDVYDFVKDGQARLYAAFSDRGYVVSLERAAADKFTKTETDFRFHKLLTAAEKEQVKAIDVKLADKKSYSFKLGQAGWALSAGTIAEFDAARVDEALVKIGSARIIDFKVTRPLPKESPELSSWTLLDKDGHPIRTLTFYGSSIAGEYFVRPNGAGAAGSLEKLDRTSAAQVPWRLEDFQKQKAPAAPAPGARQFKQRFTSPVVSPMSRPLPPGSH